ncbi:helix-turn-helix transcriptional regulator [Neorhizobium sp. T786]|uniref:helix-turn-helix domain-containing protein n=1 Tax=Pseudorhizobium xiangyangii TaxID=2883104 RepID=UPI001CFF6205|nr:helix-turn-helix transcriptional regulator [Neorhizobium xiangyangii]MCB5205123.1 helix-turn-helix transcriptional regulator [Neorhizobium xiangyangii]
MEIRKTFASNLRLMRQTKGLSQEELAHRAEIDRTYVSSLERGIYSPSIDVLEKLASALGVSPGELIRPHE